MKKIIIGLIVVISVFCVWMVAAYVNQLGRQEGLQIEPFPNVKIKEIICFEAASGNIVWKRKPEQLNEINKIPRDSSVIGLGYFGNGPSEAIIFYNISKNLLTSNVARNARCKCCQGRLKGEVLKYVNMFQNGFLFPQKAFLLPYNFNQRVNAQEHKLKPL